jgi:DNA-directed RNA polymerase specialized sigma24 family protein
LMVMEGDDAGGGEVLRSLLDLLPDGNGSPEDEYLRASLWVAIEAAVDALPADQRFVFVQHEFEGVSFRELAAVTGETENTLRMRKYYAVQFLRERLVEWM